MRKTKPRFNAKKNVKPIPKGFHTVTPYLAIKGADSAIEFYKKAFDAKERKRVLSPDEETVVHAEIQIGDSILMMSEEMPQHDMPSPKMLNGTPICLSIYTENVDDVFNQAVEAGARVIKPVEDQFHGDRVGYVEDPFGYKWAIMRHIEDVSPQEINKRMMNRSEWKNN